MNEQQIRQIIRDELSHILKIDRYVFDKPLQLLDSRNIQTGTKNGTMIATTALQKLGFFGVSPVVQQAAIGQASGGATIDSQARTAINSLLSELHSLGLIA